MVAVGGRAQRVASDMGASPDSDNEAPARSGKPPAGSARGDWGEGAGEWRDGGARRQTCERSEQIIFCVCACARAIVCARMCTRP